MPDYMLGARQRATDPAEIKYRLTAPALVDLSQPRSLAPWRTRVENQLRMGSCVAHAVTSAAEMLYRMSGDTPEQLDRLWLYYVTRLKEGSFPQDSGSFPADALDIAMTGLPPESAEPLGYIDDPAYHPPPSVDAAATIDYIAAHRPFYGSDPGGFVAGIWTALDQRMPVVIAMSWHVDFFNPLGGILPVRDPHSGIVGGHCILAWGWQPGVGVWCRNSWGSGWSDASPLNPEAEAGDFCIPAELFTNGVVWECRAVSGEAFIPPPPPVPASTYTARINKWTWQPARGDWAVDRLADVPFTPESAGFLGMTLLSPDGVTEQSTPADSFLTFDGPAEGG